MQPNQIQTALMFQFLFIKSVKIVSEEDQSRTTPPYNTIDKGNNNNSSITYSAYSKCYT
jgi:hypothetical protein